MCLHRVAEKEQIHEGKVVLANHVTVLSLLLPEVKQACEHEPQQQQVCDTLLIESTVTSCKAMQHESGMLKQPATA